MKKLIALTLAGVMTAAMVTGCGGSSETAAEAPAETEETEAPAETEETEAPAETEEGAEDAQEPSGDSDVAYVQEKGTLVVGITDFEPMDYKDESGERILDVG